MKLFAALARTILYLLLLESLAVAVLLWTVDLEPFRYLGF